MKRILTFLVACALTFSMAACGKTTQKPVSAPLESASAQSSESVPQSSAVASSSQTVQESSAPLLSEPEIPVEKPEPLTSEPSAKTVAQGPESNVPIPWWQEAFSLSDAEQVFEKVYRYSDQVCTSIISEDRLSLLGRLNPVSGDDIGAPLTDLNTLMLTTESDVRYILTLYEKGVTVSKAEAGGDSNAPHSLLVDAAQYEILLKQLRESMKEGMWSASWLSLMRESKAEKLLLTNAARNQTAVYHKEDLNFGTVFCSLNNFLVEPGSMQKVGSREKLDNATHIQIDFTNGITYHIWMSEKELVVTSTDMSYGLRYKAESTNGLYEEMCNGKSIPLTAKPVIYLYPETPTDVSVKVHFKGRLFNTLPAYHDGWNITAYPDGTLIDKTDGKRYDSLFWDGNARVDWDFEEGFSVRGTDSERFLREKLSFLGLNEKEMKDFIEFWLSELQQNRYNLITFSTEQYEAIAPLEISPKPDQILRVHMVFKPMSGPTEIPAQTLHPFERGGFTAVEWGGSRT